ncbi:glyoxalase [Rhizocola hellebori]|uniref:Glyoxalase n=1 Tax=Rhizocola hellebori TaxID=1392758 RepID=A0A8J3Q2Y1_9ACTN|nr:VOC family protein [Rhizocola hellebori]GIH02744.1 glyoxalase [Rhizocola hellebori]
MSAIGVISSIALECPDPAALADFYRQLTGWEVVYADPDWCSIAESRDASLNLSFQRSPGYQPPVWPDPGSSMQFHLHVKVADLDEAERKVLALGATAFPDQPSPDTVRVMADPVGHVFCLVPQRSFGVI